MTNMAGILLQSRISPISRGAASLTLALGAVALIAATWTQLRFTALPNLLPLTAAVFALDLASQFAPQTRAIRALQTMLYGVLYLAITCFCGVLAAYATQRLGFPLRDQLFERADLALGINWLDVVHWVDSRPLVHALLKLAYDSMSLQVALPVVVLAFSDRNSEVRKYLLGFVIALTMTIIVAALLPATSPVALVDRAAFHVMRFTGATPVDHLMRLRLDGPVVIGDALGGIVSFPSFHATVACLTPLVLRNYRALFIALLVLNAAMLCATVTEGAHYASDVIAGAAVAFVAYFLADRIVGAEDRRSSGALTTHTIARELTHEGRAA